jgi:flagellar hook assembly protein FlgD
LPRQESLSILNPESTDLTLLFPYLQEEDGLWTITVTNRSGEVIRRFSDSGQPPRQINWDWTDGEGEPLDQGIYTCQFEWEGPSGTYQSNQQKISVQKTLRKITIEVMSSPEALDKPSDALELRIKK